MGWFEKSPERRDAEWEMREARRRLDDRADYERRHGIYEETDAYLRLNRELVAAEERVSRTPR